MKSTLFGYTVEEDEGKLVITVNGLIAEGLINQIRQESQAGRGGQLLTRLLPPGSLYKMLSFAPEPTAQNAEEPLSIEQLLGQNIDQTFSAFEQQITDLKSSIAELGGSTHRTGKVKES